jgi:hypothetical protein
MKFMYEEYDEDGDSFEEYIFHSHDFYSDYFIPGIEKEKSVYLLNLRKKLKKQITKIEYYKQTYFYTRRTKSHILLLKT